MLQEISMRVAIASSLVCVLPLALAGCSNNPYALQKQTQTLQQQQIALQQKYNDLQTRASAMDRDNQELGTLLAQARQQNKLTEDQLVAVRDQLSGLTSQLTQLRDAKQLTEKQAEALMASTRRRTGATITANNSLERNLPVINVPGVEVRPDGDVVRIELPAARLFQSGGATLQPAGGTLIDTVAIEIARAYPEQTIGIEAHTSNEFIRTSQGYDNQQLSVAQATAVYQYLVQRGQIPAARMFIAGHGANHPVVSNATAAGKSRNARVELVVYPEKVANR
jgi:flagellar motor protein MotB